MYQLSVGETLAGWFYDLCSLVSSILDWLIGLLPDSTLNALSELPAGVAQYLGWVNWFLPVTEIAIMLAGWVGALLLYYVVVLIMKFFKVVGGAG